ncbi:hypothetical protein B0H19DRAFT_1079837 [Mycena capillaripes]|nr:hypothetical protein B0H19DRAFT_1079837 [Mycena capillaripes]
MSDSDRKLLGFWSDSFATSGDFDAHQARKSRKQAASVTLATATSGNLVACTPVDQSATAFSGNGPDLNLQDCRFVDAPDHDVPFRVLRDELSFHSDVNSLCTNGQAVADAFNLPFCNTVNTPAATAAIAAAAASASASAAAAKLGPLRPAHPSISPPQRSAEPNNSSAISDVKENTKMNFISPFGTGGFVPVEHLLGGLFSLPILLIAEAKRRLVLSACDLVDVPFPCTNGQAVADAFNLPLRWVTVKIMGQLVPSSKLEGVTKQIEIVGQGTFVDCTPSWLWSDHPNGGREAQNSYNIAYGRKPKISRRNGRWEAKKRSKVSPERTKCLLDEWGQKESVIADDR